MQFYFIRHAQSNNNALRAATRSRLGRNEDPDLTPMGIQQAELLAELLRTGDPGGDFHTSREPIGFGLTHLYTSLMTRAVTNAWIISQALGLPVRALDEAHEVGGVYWEDPETGERVGQPGRDRAYFETTFPGILLPDSFNETGWWNRPYESRSFRPQRARRFLDVLLSRHGESEDRVAVVSHNHFYEYVLMAILGVEKRGGFHAVIYNTGISRFDYHDGIFDLVYLNRVDHLSAEIIRSVG
jgi:2,3-bisphosphoglycerate-dependent phosphoglycerate mutase